MNKFIIFFCFIGSINGSDLDPYKHILMKDGTFLTGKAPKVIRIAKDINGPWTTLNQRHSSVNNRTTYTASAIRLNPMDSIKFYRVEWLDRVKLEDILETIQETQLFGLGSPTVLVSEPWQFEATGAQGRFENQNINGTFVIRLRFDPYHKRYNRKISQGTYVTSIWIQIADKHNLEIEYPWLLIQIVANRQGMITEIKYSKESSQKAIPVDLRKDLYDGSKKLNHLELDFTEWVEKLKI